MESELLTRVSMETLKPHALVVLSMVCLLGVTGCASFAIPDQTETRPLNLVQAKAGLKLARQKAKLAELEMELSVLEMKLADYHQKIAETLVRKAEIYKQCQKWEAGRKNGRVKKAAAIDKLKALKTETLDLESENIKSEAAIAKIDLNIQKLKRKADLYIKRLAPASR
jgi:chromosome segregation ATPase